ncbi:MAG: YidC/Oxa1 family insertase periplasmic-domain containing protein, partial [Verrucomicrobiota bacterium]
TGLAGRDKDDAPNHRATFSAARDRYELADGSDQLVVPLTWRNAAGLELGAIVLPRIISARPVLIT